MQQPVAQSPQEKQMYEDTLMQKGQNLPDLTMQDPVKFVTKYKHWCNKQVQFKDGTGATITGTVTGLAFPLLSVEHPNGSVNVSPIETKLMIKGN